MTQVDILNKQLPADYFVEISFIEKQRKPLSWRMLGFAQTITSIRFIPSIKSLNPTYKLMSWEIQGFVLFAISDHNLSWLITHDD